MGLRKATEGKASACVIMQGWDSGWEQRQGLQLLSSQQDPVQASPRRFLTGKGNKVVCRNPGKKTRYPVLKCMKLGAHS